LTNSKVCWILFSIASVFIFNYLFTAPKFSFVAYDKGYIFTFGVMLIASLITGNIANKMKVQTKESSEVAYRTKILFETNKLLQKAENDDEIINVTTEQLKTLLKRNVYGSLLVNGQIEKNETINFNEDVLKYAIKNNLRVGATTEYFPEDKYLYIPISLGSNIYGIIIIEINETNIDSLENSILFSIIGECAISLENNYFLKENEKSKRIAQNEELRGNLLRSISHDLRTPLTSIAGNADNLLLNSESFSLETRKQMYLTIYEESMWLHNLVENILAITKIEEGKMNFNYTTELINDVIIEAIKRIKNNKIKHDIIYKSNYEMVLVKIDAKLIVQVIINLLDNAIKYSNEGTQIIIETIQKDKKINVTISDNGFGIPDDIKPYVFDRFYTGVIIADGRKSLGLGLALCKSIIKAHNGEILVADNEPNGTKITFTLPIEEVEFHE
jgi:two-component system sensor histidine kinase KdpD